MRSIWGFSGLFLVTALLSLEAQSADLQWSGRYRAEGNYIKNFTLDKSAGVEDSYLVHHLILEPKIIAADGLWIKSRFDIFNNALANNQIGQVFGDYTGPSNVYGAQALPPAVLTNTEQVETIQVTQLYMNWVNEFSSLTIGRAPFNFGLGMLYNSGDGTFDHFYSNKDMVAYKLVLGNISIMPAYGKVREGNLLNEDDINDYFGVVEYANSESGLSMGFIFNNRVAPADGSSPANGNDFPTSYFSSGSGNFGTAAVYDGYNAYNMNFFVKKETENFNVGVEVGFTNGYTGIQVADKTNGGNLDRVNVSSFGIAGELGYKLSPDFKLDVHAGMANGDDPDTANFEGYFFSPNYNIAMIMFNYPVGQYDVLRSSLAGSRPAQSAAAGSQAAGLGGLDTEVVTNAVYISPTIKWAIGERYDILGTFTYARTIKPSISSTVAGTGSISNSLGFESDFGLNYHPSDRFTWLTTIGLLLPGPAFSGPGGGFATDLAYGATSKAAISF